jgi:tetratricopeptide (TPR) repeat protein
MMRAARCVIALAAAGALAGPAWAQGTWVGHRPPCKLSTGHFLVNGGLLQLKQAVEARFPDERLSRLGQAKRILLQAMTTGGQAENPAAWYYLGRYYAEVPDPAGADSAFRRAVVLAPDCAADVATHEAPLAAIALSEALRLWSASQRDSAVAAFALSRGLAPGDAGVPLYEALMYASLGEPDAAARALDEGAAAVRDTTYAQRLRQAELEVARAYEAHAYQSEPAVSSAAASRVARDSLPRPIARDSALLARILADVADMRAKGGRLTPPSLAAFQRDSTTLTERLAAQRHAVDSLTVAAAAESTAAVVALAPAIRYYRRFLAHYPDEVDATLQLMGLLATTGDRAALDSLVQRVTTMPAARGPALVQAALGLLGNGLPSQAAALLEAALAANPNDQGALTVLVRAYYALGRAPALTEVARRLLALEPLNPARARAMALAWDLAGRPDSTARYLALADTGLAWNVTINQFTPGERLTSLSGFVRNVAGRPLPSMTLVFDFLDAAGSVLFRQSAAIPALPPGGRDTIQLRSEQGGAVAWRYRRE